MSGRPENKPKAEPFLMLPKTLAARTDLHPIDKLLWACIRDRIGTNGKAWPGGRTLAADLGVNRDTILAGIVRLEATGDLTVTRRGNGRTNHYTLSDESGRKIQPVGKSNRPETPAGGGRKIQPVAAGNSGPNKTDPLNKTQGGAASLPASEEKASSNGAAGRVVAAWCEGFKSRTGSAVAQGAKGRLSGTLKRLLADFDERILTQAVAAWFARDRGDYGVELFEKKLQGGDRDLLPRPEQSPPRDEYSERKVAEMRGQEP
jgi:hypothetical protein